MGWEVFSFLSVFLNLGKLFLNCINIMCREKEMKELESQSLALESCRVVIWDCNSRIQTVAI